MGHRSLLSTLAVLALLAPATAGAAQRLTPAQAKSVARAQIGPVSGPIDCLGPAGDPAPGTQEWDNRDRANQYCASERMVDELTSPSFFTTFWSQTPGIFVNQNIEMLKQPLHPHATLSQFVVGGSTTDPYRTIGRWTAAGRGRVTPISFPAADGATLNGLIFRPPSSVPGPYPGVVITTGSIQGYQQMYYWAAEGLAEAGYMVMTYDVQGQGNSDTLPANCTVTPPSTTPDCPGVPFQQGYNFFQGAEDSLNYFFSSSAAPYTSPAVAGATSNPHVAELDKSRVGIAGHSLGAGAVSLVGQCDPRVKAIIGWDNLAPASGRCRDQIPHGLPADAPVTPTLKVPGLGIGSEYFLNPTSTSTPPNPQGKSSGYAQLAGVGTDAMQINLRSSTHLEYTYVPYILPASSIGERVAWHYTLAWMDRYVRNTASAFSRLTTTTTFDDSADKAAIGAGGYDAAKAAAAPTDIAAGNVPYTIAGLSVADRMSFYYASAYSLTNPATATKSVCAAVRAGC